jgi:hypothetical protein
MIARGINLCLQAAYWKVFPGFIGVFFLVYFPIEPVFPITPLFPEFRQLLVARNSGLPCANILCFGG